MSEINVHNHFIQHPKHKISFRCGKVKAYFGKVAYYPLWTSISVDGVQIIDCLEGLTDMPFLKINLVD